PARRAPPAAPRPRAALLRRRRSPRPPRAQGERAAARPLHHRGGAPRRPLGRAALPRHGGAGGDGDAPPPPPPRPPPRPPRPGARLGARREPQPGDAGLLPGG